MEHTLHLQPRREPPQFPVGLWSLHLIDPIAAVSIRLLNFLIRLDSVLAETQVVRTLRRRLLHKLFPYDLDQLSSRVLLVYRNL